MQRILTAIGQFVRSSLVVIALVGLLSLSSLIISQASYAGDANVPNFRADQANPSKAEKQSVEKREQAYNNATKVAKDSSALEQEYEKNLESYQEHQPNSGIIKGAKQLIEKVTGND
ncbi:MULTISPECIES: hypothetical protein [Trichocoleus]|uniref:Uncharacterized protein n=1 Tax=Trichocoleus desertorum GB2-A4 TaxID=2933944 RepID=A0ABV0J7W1_9CYAN|nr:hypothetical protein [Trichocoleus sp. FACHB-46]MBD1862217.1 hypothetical protein [Trichocoleus sp. FACHB-46]